MSGWHRSDKEVLEWAQAIIGPASIHLHRDRAWSRIYRLTAARGRFVVKHIQPDCPPEEAHLALLVGTPGDLTVLATDEDRRLLLMPDHGPTLREANDGGLPLESWESVLVEHARLQRILSGRIGGGNGLAPPTDPAMRHRSGPPRGGSRDTAYALPGRPCELLDVARTLPGLEPAGLPALGALVERLEADALPLTLQHDDLHAGNVFADGLVFDWGDAFVSHPFLVLLVALGHYQRVNGLPDGHPDLDRLLHAYLDEWVDIIGHPRARRSAVDAMLLAHVGRARIWMTTGRSPQADLHVAALNAGLALPSGGRTAGTPRGGRSDARRRPG